MNNSGSAQTSSKLDTLRWVIVAILLLAGIMGYGALPVAIIWRILILGVLFAAALYVALKTMVGYKAFVFMQEASAELKRVVWPTRAETIQTTIFVSIMVCVVALILWLLDSMLTGIIGWLIA